MKKIYFAAFAFAIMSCSSDDSSETVNDPEFYRVKKLVTTYPDSDQVFTETFTYENGLLASIDHDYSNDGQGQDYKSIFTYQNGKMMKRERELNGEVDYHWDLTYTGDQITHSVDAAIQTVNTDYDYDTAGFLKNEVRAFPIGNSGSIIHYVYYYNILGNLFISASQNTTTGVITNDKEYEYDDKNFIYKNTYTNAFLKAIKGTENNKISETNIATGTVVKSYEYEYNSGNYPSKVLTFNNGTLHSTQTIQYE